MDLAKVVSVKRPYQWTEGGIWNSEPPGPRAGPRFHVVAYDFGIKRNILRLLVRITSYNVCYTKLLRPDPDCRGNRDNSWPNPATPGCAE